MTTLLIVRHNYDPANLARAAELTITLEGNVAQETYNAINSCIASLSVRISAIGSSLPPLRVENGLFEFNTSCNSLFHGTILLECFVTPLEGLGYVNEQNMQLLGTFGGHAIVYRHRAPQQDFRPFAQAAWGGNMQTFITNPLGSITLLPDTVFGLGGMQYVVMGAGWDPMRNRTYEMLFGGGPPDLDLNVYLFNRYGEVLSVVSPKGVKRLSGVVMGGDSRSGVGLEDDERFAVELYRMDPCVKTLLFTVSIVAGAKSFGQVRNTYLRMLDCENSHKEIEMWRVRLPENDAKNENRTAVMCRLEQEEKSGHWQIVTIGAQVPPAYPLKTIVSEGDSVIAINRGEIPLKKRDILVDGFRINIERMHEAPLPVILTFKTGAPIVGPNAERPEPGKPPPGTEFEVVFYADPTACLRFREGPGEAPIVSSVDWKSYIMSTSNQSNWLRPFAGQFTTPLPKFVEISRISARIAASDRGGTSDPYVYIFARKLNLNAAAAAFRDYTLVEIARSKVLSKTKCPAIVSFPDVSARIPVETMVGPLPNCYIAVYDKDAMSRDDKLLEHTVDLTWSSWKDQWEYKLHPTWVKDIEDLPANAGFGKPNVELHFTLTLLYQ